MFCCGWKLVNKGEEKKFETWEELGRRGWEMRG